MKRLYFKIMLLKNLLVLVCNEDERLQSVLNVYINFIIVNN